MWRRGVRKSSGGRKILYRKDRERDRGRYRKALTRQLTPQGSVDINMLNSKNYPPEAVGPHCAPELPQFAPGPRGLWGALHSSLGFGAS